MIIYAIFAFIFAIFYFICYYFTEVNKYGVKRITQNLQFNAKKGK